MVALAASVLLFLYIILPDAIFRFVFGQFVPLRSLVSTRVEEIYRALLTIFFPLIIALTLVWYVPPFSGHPFSFPDSAQLRRTDYKVVIGGLYSEQIFKGHGEHYWKALTRCGRRQQQLLVWYYLAVIVEGLSFGLLASRYGTLRRYQLYRVLADRLLLPNISEWHVLLTAFVFADKSTVVRADILSADNTLYRGTVSQYFLGLDGKLSGVILTDSLRFDRRSYLQDKDKGALKEKQEYWRLIPGAKLYLFNDKMLNLNLNYEPPLTVDVVTRLVEDQLKRPFSVAVELKTPSPRH